MTSAGGPQTIIVGADTSQAVAGLNEIIKSAALTRKEIDSLDKSIGKLTATDDEMAAGLQNTLGLYGKMIGVTATYRKSLESETAALVTNKAARNEMAASFASLDKALSKVNSTTKEEYLAQGRTLDLYKRMIGLSQQAADIKLKEAAALDKVASAQARTITSTMKMQAADEKAAAAAEAKAAAEVRAAEKAAAAAAASAGAGAAGAAAGAGAAPVGAAGASLAGLSTTRNALLRVATAYGVVSAAAILFAKTSITTAESYEQAWAQVIRTTGATAMSLVPLQNALEELSTVIPKSFQDLAGIAQMGAQMGIPAQDLEGFTRVIAEFSATTNVATTQAATDFGKLANLLDVPTAQFENLASTVSYLGVTSVATETQILNVSQSIAATGHTVGMSTQEILGLSSAFASLAVSPEQARSAMARLFLDVDKAVSAGGKSLQSWADLLGISTQQVKQLRATDPDRLFNDIVAAFHNIQQSGGDLTGTFTTLGLKSIRDIQVFERLANGFDVVTNSIQNANKAYADGTYLEASFATVNETVSAKAQKVADAYSNLLANIGNSSVIQGAVKGILDGILALLKGLDSLPGYVKVGISTFVTMVGIFAAYKASMALITAGMLAFRQATGGLNGQTIGLRSAIAATRGAFGGAAVAADQYTAATKAAGAASWAATAGLDAQTVALEEQMAAKRAAAGVGAATAAEGVGSGLLGGLLKLTGWGAAISVAAGGIAALIQLFNQSDSASAKAAEDVQKYGAALLEAGGGAQSLMDALDKDQAAFVKAGNSTEKLDGYFGKVVEHFDDLGNGTAKVTRTFYDMNGVSTDLGNRIEVTGAAVDNFSGSQTAAQGSIKKTNKALEDQVTVLGSNSEKWLQNAITQVITGDNSPFKDNIGQLMTMFASATDASGKKIGITMGQAIADGVQHGTAKLDADMAPIYANIEANAKIAADKARAVYEQGMGKLSDYKIGSPARNTYLGGLQEAENAATKPYQASIDMLNQFKEQVTGSTTALGGMADKATLLNQIEAAFPPIADASAASSDGLTTALTGTTAKVQTMAQALQAASTAFTDMLGLMSDTVNQSLAVSDSMNALGKSIADNGTSFDQFSEGGRKNLESLLGVVGAVGQELATQIQNGQMTAQQAAVTMQEYMQNLVTQLSGMGVPTDQIDFLVKYLNQVVSHKWGISVGADISNAMAGLDTVGGYAAQIETMINDMVSKASLTGAQATSGYNILEGAAMEGYGSSIVPAPVAAPKYSGPTSFYGDNRDVLNAGYEQEKAANASKAASAASKDASKGAKDAAKTAKDAADAQTAAAKAQKDYLDALGTYLAGFGKSTMSMIDLTGNTVESLQKLGESITENGKRFNVFTQGGRANWQALEGAITSYGTMLQAQVTNKTLTAGQAMAQMKQYAGGIYSELIALGVPAKDIDAYFKSMGIDTTGWSHASAAVKQYAGYITAAADATGALMKQTDKTSDYISRLTTALDAQATAYFGLQDAQDAVASQYNSMKQHNTDTANQINDLIEKNRELNATIGDQQVIANKAHAAYLIDLKYGDKARAGADYQTYTDAKGQISSAGAQVNANNAQIKALKAGKNELKGNSDAAIANRKSLQDLTETYTKQIEAYAAAGHTQEQTEAYARRLKLQFEQQGESLGYTATQLKPYRIELENVAVAVGKVPTTIDTTVNANTDAATAALNAIPTTGTYTITSSVNYTTRVAVLKTLAAIPKQADYKVTATANTSPATTAIGKIPKTGGYSITPTVKPLTATQKANLAAGLPKNFNLSAVLAIRQSQMDSMWANLKIALQKKENQSPLYIVGNFVAGPGGTGHQYTGGLVAAVPMKRSAPRYAEGGLLPGTPPANPTVDNLVATGPEGIYRLRSREFIQSQPAVDFYGVGVMNAINQRMIPRNRFMANGGQVSGGQGGAGWGGPTELSPYDRQLLAQIRDAQPNVYVGDTAVATSASRGGLDNTRRGGS